MTRYVLDEINFEISEIDKKMKRYSVFEHNGVDFTPLFAEISDYYCDTGRKYWYGYALNLDEINISEEYEDADKIDEIRISCPMYKYVRDDAENEIVSVDFYETVYWQRQEQKWEA